MLLADIHEPKEIIEKLRAEIPVKTLRLKYGDYSFSDIVIERKTLSDFFCSLKNDRLKDGLEQLSRYYTEKYLLIEGFFDFSYVNNVGYLYNELIDFMLNFDVKVIFSKDRDFTCTIIKKFYRAKDLDYNINTAKKAKIYHAENFFGIGRKRLEALFSKFGSIRNIANADKREFNGIKSIGKKTVEKVKNNLDSNIFENME